MRFVAIILLAGGVGVSVTAQAEKVPGSMLEQDYKQCMISASRGPASEAQKVAYCSCARDRIGETFDLDAYTKLAIEKQSGQLSAESTSKLQAVAKTCIQKTFK